MSKIKQVIVMRTDLNMRKGKMISQGSHASMKFLIENMKPHEFAKNRNFIGVMNEEEKEWIFGGKFTKITVQIDSEEKLLEIFEKAKEYGLTVHKIIDEGNTEFKGVPTLTCIAIGPHSSEKIDPITGDLKLL